MFSLSSEDFNLMYKMTNVNKRWYLTKYLLDSKEREYFYSWRLKIYLEWAKSTCLQVEGSI